MEFQLSYFKSWKMMLWKCCTQYASKSGKLSSGHRTGKGVFIPIPKKGNAKEGSNYRTVALISHARKVMLKILQARLQQYVNYELPDVQAGLRKGRGTRDQIVNIHWITEKAREFQKNIYFCFIDYAKAFSYLDHNKLWKILKEMGIPDYLTCLLRNINNLICKRHHPYGRKWRGTKEPLDESERGEWKSWLKAQHSEDSRSWHLVPLRHGK